MSDDHDDTDEPGGLWDPDAFTTRRAPARPALRVIANGPPSAPESPRPVIDRAQSDNRERLVRLEEFRAASADPPPPLPAQSAQLSGRRWTVAAALVS